MLTRHFIAPLVFGAAVLAACSAAATQRDRRVAAIGDTPAQLQHGIRTARKAGMIPLYVQVTCGRRRYAYSPFAQVVRGERALIVRAYSKIFVFRLDGSQVAFDGKTVTADALPRADAAFFDSRAERTTCVPLVLPAAPYAAATDPWNGAKDPWQSGRLIPWTSGAQLDALTVPYGRPSP